MHLILYQLPKFQIMEQFLLAKFITKVIIVRCLEEIM